MTPMYWPMYTSCIREMLDGACGDRHVFMYVNLDASGKGTGKTQTPSRWLRQQGAPWQYTIETSSNDCGKLRSISFGR